MPRDFETNGVLEHIDGLSSAEEIFTYLLLPFEAEVMNVSRLHIMKRFGAYLKDADLSGLDADALFVECRSILKRAYGDFCESTPMREKVFKVFRDEEEKLKARFVAADSLQIATS